MDIINNIEWFIHTQPKTAKNKNTNKTITKKDMETIVFDDSVFKNVTFSLPLNDEFLFSETRQLPRPINVEQILTLIHTFYKEPLNQDNIDNAFKNNEEWKEEIVDNYDGDINKLTNYDVFTDNCTPDFCGLEFMEETGEYFVSIGPE
jgi:hypothetical protein